MLKDCDEASFDKASFDVMSSASGAAAESLARVKARARHQP
jgi:hypothetical protein